MQIAPKLAWRNIWRNRRRTVLTMMAVAFASAVLVFFIGLQLSSYESSINATTSVFHGHLQVQREGYSEKPQLRRAIASAEKLRVMLSELPGVGATALRATGFSLASSEERAYGVIVSGVQPQREKELSTIPGVIRKGRYLSSDSAQEAVIGQTLGANLKLAPGDSLTLLGQGMDGSLAATVVEVVGFFASGSRDLDRSAVHLPLKTFQEVFTLHESGHSIVVRAENLAKLNQLEARIQKLIDKYAEPDKPLTALRWDELLPGLKQSIELDLASSWLFYASLVLVVTFSILNTFLMSVLERTREFGVMLSLGSQPRQIAGLIIYEAVLLVFLGLIVGVALGSAVILYYGAHGFSIPGSEEIMATWNLPAAIYPRISLGALTVGPGVILLAAVLSVLYPIRRIYRLQPVEALRAA